METARFDQLRRRIVLFPVGLTHDKFSFGFLQTALNLLRKYSVMKKRAFWKIKGCFCFYKYVYNVICIGL